MAAQKHIQQVRMGIADGKAAWTFEYTDGQCESFSLSAGTARQFMQGLEEIILVLEHREKRARGPGSSVGVAEDIQVRLGDAMEMEDGNEG